MTGGDAARAVQVFDVLRPGGRKLTDIGRLAADVVEDVQRQAQFGFPEYGGQVEGRVGGAAESHVRRHSVVDGLFGHDVAGADVLFEKFHDLHTRLFGKADTGGGHGGRRAVAGQGHAMASHRQFMVLAVYMPEQEPQPGQAFSVRSSSSSSVMVPLRTAPTPSNTLMRSVLFRPAAWGRRS